MKGWLRCTRRTYDLARCDASLGAWLRLPILSPPPPHTHTQFAESPKQLGAGRAWLWRAALAVIVLLPLLAELPQAAAQTVPTLKVEIPTVTEGENGTIKLTLSQESNQSIEITVNPTTISACGVGITCPQGTAAAAANDYSLGSVTATFAIGETNKTVSFTTTDDSTSGSTEVFVKNVGSLDPTEATVDPRTPADGTEFGNPYWFVPHPGQRQPRA